MSRKSYSDETKAAVMAALLTGQSITSIAKEYDIPKGTVGGWKKKAVEVAGDLRTEATQKSGSEHIGVLLVEYLEANLKALKVQAEQFADRQWLEKQHADQAAVLHGVLTDKAVRLLEALSRAADD